MLYTGINAHHPKKNVQIFEMPLNFVLKGKKKIKKGKNKNNNTSPSELLNTSTHAAIACTKKQGSSENGVP